MIEFLLNTIDRYFKELDSCYYPNDYPPRYVSKVSTMVMERIKLATEISKSTEFIKEVLTAASFSDVGPVYYKEIVNRHTGCKLLKYERVSRASGTRHNCCVYIKVPHELCYVANLVKRIRENYYLGSLSIICNDFLSFMYEELSNLRDSVYAAPRFVDLDTQKHDVIVFKLSIDPDRVDVDTYLPSARNYELHAVDMFLTACDKFMRDCVLRYKAVPSAVIQNSALKAEPTLFKDKLIHGNDVANVEIIVNTLQNYLREFTKDIGEDTREVDSSRTVFKDLLCERDQDGRVFRSKESDRDMFRGLRDIGASTVTTFTVGNLDASSVTYSFVSAGNGDIQGIPSISDVVRDDRLTYVPNYVTAQESATPASAIIRSRSTSMDMGTTAGTTSDAATVEANAPVRRKRLQIGSDGRMHVVYI